MYHDSLRATDPLSSPSKRSLDHRDDEYGDQAQRAQQARELETTGEGLPEPRIVQRNGYGEYHASEEIQEQSAQGNPG